ncbi:uncharacterized protein [Linepithema humile]|uniref:uncharacterized protein isoform X1 n=1 Tax=Linepithema humile TaxID=83485 RepID=UPI00351EB767
MSFEDTSCSVFDGNGSLGNRRILENSIMDEMQAIFDEIEECEMKNKRDEEDVSTEGKKTSSSLIKEIQSSLLKQLEETQSSLLKQLEERQKIKRRLKIYYPELEFKEIDLETLKKDLMDVNAFARAFKKIVWGKNAIENWTQEVTAMPKECPLLELSIEKETEEMESSDTKVIQKDTKSKESINRTELDKYTFEEYLSMLLQRKCSKLLKKHDQYVQQIEEKSKDLNNKIEFLSEMHERLQIKFNNIKKDDLTMYGHTCGTLLTKLMKRDPQLRNEVYVSYKKQYKGQKEAVNKRDKILEEGTKWSYPGKCITTQKDIEVSYQKQCDENLQTVKSLIKIEYASLLRKMVTKSLQEGMSLKDYRLKCTKEDSEMLNKIPGPFLFKEEFNCRKDFVNEITDNLENLFLRYDYLQSDIKCTENVVGEMKKNVKIELKHRKTPWYTINNPKIRAQVRQVQISYEKQRQELLFLRAKKYANLMLEEIKASEEGKKSCKKLLRKDKIKKEAAMKIHDIQKDTENSFKEQISECEMSSYRMPTENSEHESFLYLGNLEENVKDPRIVRRMLQKGELPKMYAAILTKNMNSLYKNMLFKHTIHRHHNDNYTTKFKEIIETNVKRYINRHKKLNQSLEIIFNKLLIMENKLNKRQVDLEKLKEKMEKLEKNISVINGQPSKNNTQNNILTKTLSIPNVDRTLDPEIKDSYKTQAEDEERALENINIQYNINKRYNSLFKSTSMRKKLKKIHKIKKNYLKEIFHSSSQKTRKFNDNVEQIETVLQENNENDVELDEKEAYFIPLLKDAEEDRLTKYKILNAQKPNMTNRSSELENEIQNIKQFNINNIEEIVKLHFAIHELQTTIKKLDIEFNNIKSHKKHDKCEIGRNETLRRTEELEKKFALWQECYKESQKVLATVTADNQSIKLKMTDFEKIFEKKNKTQTKEERALENINEQLISLFDESLSIRKELKETYKIKENDLKEIFPSSSQKTSKFDDNVKEMEIILQKINENDVKLNKKKPHSQGRVCKVCATGLVIFERLNLASDE